MHGAILLVMVLALQPEGAPDVELVRDVVYAQATAADGSPVTLMMDVAFPRRGEEPLPAVIYVHGGGYAHGSKAHGRPVLIGLADGGYLAVSIDYRLSGQAPFPAAVHDCKAAVRFLRASAADLGIDPGRIGVIGHSAGGHLSALLAVSGNTGQLDGELEPGGVSSAVACAVDISGPCDLGPHAGAPGSVLRRWLGEDDETYARNARAANPVAYVDATDPAVLIVHGADDDLVPPDSARQLKAAIDAAGAPAELLIVEGQGHAVADPAAYVRIAAFLDEHLGGRAAATLPARLPGGNRGPAP